jgi:hypothetical protein
LRFPLHILNRSSTKENRASTSVEARFSFVDECESLKILLCAASFLALSNAPCLLSNFLELSFCFWRAAKEIVWARSPKTRAKPVLPFCGAYHLIDFPLSNCAHSGLSDVWVIEQFSGAFD